MVDGGRGPAPDYDAELERRWSLAERDTALADVTEVDHTPIAWERDPGPSPCDGSGQEDQQVPSRNADDQQQTDGERPRRFPDPQADHDRQEQQPDLPASSMSKDRTPTGTSSSRAEKLRSSMLAGLAGRMRRRIEIFNGGGLSPDRGAASQPLLPAAANSTARARNPATASKTDPRGAYAGRYPTPETAAYWLWLAGLVLFGAAFLIAGRTWLGVLTAGGAMGFAIFYLRTGMGFVTPAVTGILGLFIGVTMLLQ